jgi:hypothetical protein
MEVPVEEKCLLKVHSKDEGAMKKVFSFTYWSNFVDYSDFTEIKTGS